MSRYRMYLFLMMKRLWKKPAFVFFLFCLPFLAVGTARLDRGERPGVQTGIVIAGNEDEAKADWNREFLALLTGPDSPEEIIQFQIYEEKAQLVRDVKKGELECGVVFPADMRERLDTGQWRDSMILYQSPSSSMTGAVKERLAAAVFTMFSEERYETYLADTPLFDGAEAAGTAREEILAFAKEAYETHLEDGSTFAFSYQGEGYTGEDGSAYHGKSGAGASFRLRGVLAVCIFLSGLCGLLTDWKDRQEQRFIRIVPGWVTTMVNIWIPTFFTSLFSLASLCLAGEFAKTGAPWLRLVGEEACRLLFYQLAIVLYCGMLRLFLRKQETIAAAIPLLTLAGMVCCPVWIRLAVYLPVFRVLEKLFPVTWYLLL